MDSRRLVVPKELRRGPERAEVVAIDAARALIEHMTHALGHRDLSGLWLLDVGCGVRFTQALLAHSMPIGRYVGIEVHKPIVEFLTDNVADDRFEYHHVDLRNARYNPAGTELSAGFALPVPEAAFDIICLFSVFTHTTEQDYVSMLRVLRRHVAAEGRGFYTIYLDELTPAGLGMMDGMARRVGPELVGRTDGYRDMIPEKPLLRALYTRDHAVELLDGTGWRLVDILDPTKHAQHQFVIAPTA